MTITDWIGSMGVIVLLAAYYFNLVNKIKTVGLTYIGLNFLGAGASCVASCLLHYFPFIILEGIWTLVSLVAFIKCFKKT